MVACTADRSGLKSDAGEQDQQIADQDIEDVFIDPIDRDTMVPDADMPDISIPDMSLLDMNLLDMNLPDMNLPDRALPDMTVPDVNLPDINVPDIGPLCPQPIISFDFTGSTPARDTSTAPPNPEVQLANRGSSFTPQGLTFDGTQTTTAKITNENQINDALKAGGSFSVRVLFRTADMTQGGPRRILTSSENGSLRNFSVLQQSREVWIRLRTTFTNENGTAIAGSFTNNDVLTLKSGNILNNVELFDVVFSFDASSTANNHMAIMYINGLEVAREDHGAGTLANWANYQWGLGNEVNIDQRPWTGTVVETQIWEKPLSPRQVLACSI